MTKIELISKARQELIDAQKYTNSATCIDKIWAAMSYLHDIEKMILGGRNERKNNRKAD